MGTLKLLESFDQSILNSGLNWHCEPASWKIENSQLIVATDAETDFWQKTHYGFQADNGHFLYTEMEGDFTIEAQIRCDFRHQYDQAGLIVRISYDCWVKTSVEYEPNESNKLGAVVTNHGYSDWSTQNVDDGITEFRLKIIRRNSDYIIHYFSADAKAWIQLRMFHLFDQPVVKAGLYCCSPKNNGFKSYFDYLNIS